VPRYESLDPRDLNERTGFAMSRVRYMLAWLLRLLPMIGAPQAARDLPITTSMQADPANMIFITIAG
jgi:hypothetical protein